MIKNITMLESNVVNGGSTCICAPDPEMRIHMFAYAYDADNAEQCRRFCMRKGQQLYPLFYFNPDNQWDPGVCLTLVTEHIDIFASVEGSQIKV